MKKTALLAVGLIFTLGLQAQKAIKYANTIAITPDDSKEIIIEKAAHVVPTTNQLSALKNEFIAFIHFGPNTFTRREWGTGKEDPKIFQLKTLDTDQWCAAMKAAGIKMVLFTAKHHDGFVLWQSRYTKHGIMSSDFRNGKGDIMRDLSASCQKYGIKLGVYLSPADLYQIESPDGLYGNLSKYTMRTIPREVPGRPFKNKTKFKFKVDDYNEYFLNQLFELLTEYGPIYEVWFDGAHPKRKGGQTYNYHAWKKLIRTLAPKAVIFGKEDIRWCGNEAGGTRSTEWNVVPFTANPDTMSVFPDMTKADLGSREQLYKGKYLHYEQAETNTSIREGWFYRDDTNQKVRSTDDVFDIYERAVGGNSTFLLNIPPNREGRFSDTDVKVLEETGERIRQTYSTNLLKGATGPKAVLDDNTDTYINVTSPIIITTDRPITFNRLMLQEAVAVRGERVEAHAIDAWINNEWKEIAQATNIGYKRILRFPDVTTQKIRIRITSARLTPTLCTVSAHYYQSRPPQLIYKRTKEGLVTIEPLKQAFNWKDNGENSAGNLNAGFKIYYTTDGTQPDSKSSELYTGPFKMGTGILKAVSILNNQQGALLHEQLGYIKQNWKLLETSGEEKEHKAISAFDDNTETYWKSGKDNINFLSIDLGSSKAIKGFAYTPKRECTESMMEQGDIYTSQDGTNWKKLETFEFGNLINDPSKRFHYFKNPATARYTRIEATKIAGNGNSVAIAEVDFF